VVVMLPSLDDADTRNICQVAEARLGGG
jgi:hypothetical protein